MNKEFINSKLTSAKELSLFFDGTPTLNGSHILGIGVIIDGVDSIVIKMIQNEARGGAKEDAKLIIEVLESNLTNFESVAREIYFVVSDNCSEAKLTRQTIIEILDEKYPLEVEDAIREVIKCSGKSSFMLRFSIFYLSARVCTS